MRLSCSQGHQWELPADEASHEEGPQYCPICDAPLSPSDKPHVHRHEVVDYAGGTPRGVSVATPAETRVAVVSFPSAGDAAARNSAQRTFSLLGAPPTSARRFPFVPGYEILAELGRGGMGVVYQARQLSLNRLVALKMILSGELAGTRELSRFRTEAEAVARIRHPNLVTIYEINEWHGRPYFALEYLEGGNLAELVASKPLSATAAAGLLEPIAQAMHAAHQAGVIHRDLKPANILLTADRVPKVADFGLAKRLDSDSGITRSDSILGTPSYMAPEQAIGRSGTVGPAADVYALGAILYELLTGRPPFLAANWAETVQQVRETEPVPPRRLRPTVPRDLDTICLKCLEKAPRSRYPSASALADDLRRFLDGRPVVARPTSVLERAWKWAKRRPLLALLGSGLVVGSVGAFGAGLWWDAQIRHYNAELSRTLAAETKERQRAEADEADLRLEQDKVTREWHRAEQLRQLAEKNVLDLHRSIRGLTVSLLENRLLHESGQQELRRTLLRELHGYYRSVVAQRSNDPLLRAELARGAAQIARLTGEIGTPGEAIAEYENASGLFNNLIDTIAEPPKTRAYRADLAACQYNLGYLHRVRGRTEQAETAFRAALELRRQLATEEPTYRAAHAASEQSLGLLASETGKRDQAEASYRSAQLLWEAVVRDGQATAEDRAALASSYNNHGLLHHATGRIPTAKTLFENAVAVLDPLVREAPKVGDYRAALGASHSNLGLLAQADGRLVDAETAYQQARTVLAPLAAANPNVSDYQNDLAALDNNLGTLYRQLARPDSAEQAYQRAVALREQLPAVARYRGELAGSYTNLGVIYAATGRLVEAEKVYQKALTVQELLVAENPSVARYRSELAGTENNLGLVHAAANRATQAEASYRRALMLQEPIVRANPELTTATVSLGGTYLNLGTLLRSTGKPSDALTWYDRAATTLETVLRQTPGSTEARQFLRDVASGRAVACTLLNRHADAVRDWTTALTLDPDQALHLRIARAASRARAGDHQKAGAEADDLARGEKVSGQECCSLGAVYALAAAAVPADGSMTRTKRDHWALQYATQALLLLKRAEAGGYFHDATALAAFKKDHDFAALLPSSEFRDWLSGLEKNLNKHGTRGNRGD